MTTSSRIPCKAVLPQHVKEAREDGEEEITPSTTAPDSDAECERQDFGCSADEDHEESDSSVPQQLQAGPPPPPMEDDVPKQLQAGPPPPVTGNGQVSVGVRPPPAAEPAAAPQEAGKAEPFSCSETFFVFDYDDTVLPSTWIQRQGLRLDAASRPTPEQMSVLGEVAAVAGRTLQLARQHGTVIFVTNAERGWIELSCQKFMPTLAPMLENIKMVSARTTYEGPSAPSPLDWKLRAFEDQMAQHFGPEVLSDPSQRKNMLSLGDGIHEREALLNTAAGLPSCAAKSLKFVERPDISQIVKQHELITHAFENIVHHAGDLDLRIRCP